VSDAVRMRRLHVGLTARAELVEAQVVDQDQQGVGLRITSRLYRHDGLQATAWRALPPSSAGALDWRERPRYTVDAFHHTRRGP